MRITLVALLAACSAALRCTHTARFPLAQRRCSVVADGGAELATLPSQLGRVASWAGEVVVVKYGGHAMTDPELSKSFAADCALMQSLGVRVVVVHGGGPQINAMLKKLEIKSEFVAGLRVTDSATMDAAEMVLCGSINKQIASSITLAGGRAVGLSGKDDKMVTAKRKMHVEEDGTEVSLGQVGEPGAVRTGLLESLLDSGIVPVIAPVAIGGDGMSYNVNADTMSGAIAAALGARALLLLTDVAGVLDAAPADGGKLLPTLSLDDVTRLKAEGVITGGMIPKLETACDAVSGGCGSAVIMDGRVQHCTLQHFFGEGGVGTAVVENE
jgi:acetylglutamate kinase